MGGLDEMDFGADTDAIRRWLAKRATYADDVAESAHGGKHRVDLPGTVDPQRMSVPNNRDAGQHVLDALVTPEPPVAKRWPPSYQPATAPDDASATAASTDPAAKGHPTPPPRTGTTPGHGSPYASTPEHEEAVTASRSTNAVFKPLVAARHATTVTFLAIVALTVGAAYRAYQEPTVVNQGLAVLLVLLALVVWGVWASTSVTELAVIRGQLEIIRNGKFEVIDLASIYTPVAVEGKPGHRGWRVLIERHDQPLLVIDGSMVDPRAFTAVLFRVRPDLKA
ncbi:hypothetical protein [Nocardioides bizhenqiangii]|uniref:PH domain-containing protein n=1 Tax=Nocardioides bizhenqiangii TaxID=3095076 RepID=A0ABZ0ZNX0_9ACTN|nr:MULTISPECIES: hypothetical protein [unclassified Nocardioides]MDZ5619967.1 hypothetical protein [Nocardioides sp. HM23]WQQ26030.1 hypothetical protein SHK19_18935 [Nocardioides sp. HM61]